MLRFLRPAYVLFACITGQAWGACTSQPIDFGETRNGTIAADDCQNTTNAAATFYYDSYAFSGVAGQKIAVTMNNTSSIDPLLFLVNPDRTAISDNNSGGGVNARIPATGFLTLTQTGVHEIQAVAVGVARATGTYRLMLTSSTPAACHVAADPQSSATLPLAAGTAVQISAVCSSGTAPITYTWDGGAFSGAVRNVTPAATTTYSIVGSNANGSSPPFSITVHVAAPPPGSPTVEFYNINLRHYFVTAVQAEAMAIDSGSAGAGWVRTGFSYDVYTSPVNHGGIATVPVCRFYGTPGKGPNSHFYTADATECAAVKQDPGWFYEGIAYHIQPPVNGGCPAGTQPIYRTYNNRAAQNDSNHRFITNSNTFDQMAANDWVPEGIVMCTTSVRSPSPVVGGTFNDPGGSGAGVAVSPGTIPPSVNATSPQTQPTHQFPAALVSPADGETNVTRGAQGYDFDLTGDGGFATNAAGAVKVSMPFDATSIPAADRTNPIKVFTRIYDRSDGASFDLVANNITLNGTSGIIVSELRGLPSSFTAAVIFNPDADFVTSDQAVTNDGLPLEVVAPVLKSAASTTWPVQRWCSRYNPKAAPVVDAVKAVLGIAGTPTLSQIKQVIRSKAVNSALQAQAAFQNDGAIAPNLGTGTACGSPGQYYINIVNADSHYQPRDPGAPMDPSGGSRYGSLFLGADRIPLNDAIGSAYGVVAHELLHAIQTSYGLLGFSTLGYKEGTATIYAKTLDSGGVITVRPEMTLLDQELMAFRGNNKYGNEDFWAFVGKQYNGGKISFIIGVLERMLAVLGPNDHRPGPATLYNALDGYLTKAFNKTLQEVYLEFVKQRALTHNQNSRFGRGGEVVNGFAANVFGRTSSHNLDVGTCAANKATLSGGGFVQMSTQALVIKPTGALPPGDTTGIAVTVKFVPQVNPFFKIWDGWIDYNGTTAAVAGTNKFQGFGKSGNDRIVLLASNLGKSDSSGFSVEITCGELKIDSLAPARGKIGDVVTINGSGFGSATDVRKVTFNGLAATAVSWVSESQLRATVPANASTGNVIVTLGTESSNGVSFEVFAACSVQQTAGGDTPDTRTIELGKTSGTFAFTYETFAQEDRMLIFYQSNPTPIFDSGCVGTNGPRTANITYSGASTSITVQVIPNCRTGTGTFWNYSVACP